MDIKTTDIVVTQILNNTNCLQNSNKLTICVEGFLLAEIAKFVLSLCNPIFKTNKMRYASHSG